MCAITHIQSCVLSLVQEMHASFLFPYLASSQIYKYVKPNINHYISPLRIQNNSKENALASCLSRSCVMTFQISIVSVCVGEFSIWALYNSLFSYFGCSLRVIVKLWLFLSTIRRIRRKYGEDPKRRLKRMWIKRRYITVTNMK